MDGDSLRQVFVIEGFAHREVQGLQGNEQIVCPGRRGRTSRQLAVAEARLLNSQRNRTKFNVGWDSLREADEHFRSDCCRDHGVRRKGSRARGQRDRYIARYGDDHQQGEE